MDAEEKLHILPLENEEDTASVLTMCLSVTQMATLCAIINHVPENFPDRNVIIRNICQASPLFASTKPESVLHFLWILQCCPNLTTFHKDNPVDISSLLWQASWLHKEPYLAFINPPVTECVQCEETLYSFARVAVTLYNLSGPIPGQRGVLKCKSCQMYYHVDGYSMPSQGKAYFIRYQVPASGKVLATECFGAKTCTLKSLHCWIKSLNLT